MFDLVSAIQNQPSLAAKLGVGPMLLIIGGAIVISILLGNYLANRLRSPSHGWRIATMFGVLSVAVLAIVFTWPPKFGVDLRGGITIIGQLRQDPDRRNNVDIKTMIPQILRRVDTSGTKEILIRPLGTDKIEVVIPDVDMEEAMLIWERMTQAGELRFRIVADKNYHSSLANRAIELIQAGVRDNIVHEKADSTIDNKTGKIVGQWYELAREDPREVHQGAVPFKVMPNTSHLVRDGKTKMLIDVQPFRGDPTAFAQWADEQKINRVEILCVEPYGPDDDYNVEGEHLKDAFSEFDSHGNPAVGFVMTSEGRRRMATLTGHNVKTETKAPLLAIISDGALISNATINSRITDRGIIEGRFSQKEVNNLVTNLDAGKLEVALSPNPISQDFQQSTIGEELKQRGIWACIISLIIIGFVMCIYYRFGGFIATVVLVFNLILVMAIVMIIKAPLTLTGLAGIVLTIGMSVDANVLIYERLREELKKGASLRMAIRNGYDRAMSTIVDSNVTTLLTAFVLYVVGTEQLRGFAVTLIFGILTSMFTAIFCSRIILELAERNGWITSLKMMSIFSGRIMDFVGWRRVWYGVSLATIAIGVVGMFFRGSEILDHDLRGGSTARIVLSDQSPMSVEQVRELLGSYKGQISEREPIQFHVASIDSKEFQGRVFKVDSNIPVWEQEGTAPYKQMREVLVEVFGNRLMKLKVDYDPAKLQVSKIGAETPATEPASSVEKPSTGRIESSRPTPSVSRRSMRLPWASTLATTQSLASLLVQDPAPNQETEPAPVPSEEGQSDSAKQESTQQEPAKQEPIQQDQKAPAQETQPGAEAAQATPPGAERPSAQAPAVSGVERYLATTELKFAQPIARGALTEALIDAAAKTNQVTLTRDDIQLVAEGKDAEDLSVKSTVWKTTLQIGNKDDGKLILESFQSRYDGQPYFPTISGVGGQIAAETQWRALTAILLSLVIIVLYVWIRFQSVGFGVGAIIALVHDVLITLGAVALSYWLAPILGFAQVENFRVSLPVIASVLTLIGYSINDTIVVFDRIREVRGKRTELTPEMINLSVSQTLSRTIMTSALTWISVLVLYVWGGESIHGFAFCLVVGIVVGTYSSIFIASPIALWWINRSLKQKSQQKAAA